MAGLLPRGLGVALIILLISHVLTLQNDAYSPESILDEIIHKYSNGQDFMTQAQFSKLSMNLLGCKNHAVENFTVNQEEKCLDVHSHFCNVFTQCHDKVLDILRKISVNNFRPSDLLHVCPLLLHEIDSEVGHEEKTVSIKVPPSKLEVWGYGILFVSIINLSSLVGVSVLPFMAKSFYTKLLTCLIGLSVGSLASTSIFHLIPQTFSLQDKVPHHEYLKLSSMILCGIYVFFVVERIMKMIFDWKEKSQKQFAIDGKDTFNGPCTDNHSMNSVANSEINISTDTGNSNFPCVSPDINVVYVQQEQAIKASFGHSEKPHHENLGHQQVKKNSEQGYIATIAWMIIFGDGLHNFVDGLSIGAGFNSSILTGISISVAIMCEEFPHELGDFAVLLHSGMTVKQAMLYNFLSACLCYVGLIIGILLGSLDDATVYIFGTAAGMFLYISLVDMVPEMNEVARKASEVGLSEALKVFILQNCGMFVGGSIIFTLAYYQDEIALE